MNDVSPEILEAVKKQFDKEFYSNTKIKKIYEKVRKGKASFSEMKTFAEMAGDILSESLDKVFSSGDLPDGKLYQNIAEKVITPMLQQNHSLVNEVCGYVMDDKNAAAKIGVKAVTAGFNTDRAEKIAQIAANSGGVKKGSKAAQLITNMSLSFVDEFIQANADLHKDLGMVPQIQRIYHSKPGGCGFCEERVYSGEYKGPDMPEGIFQRHRDCKCTLIYEPRKGKYQDPWSKREASEYEQLVSDQRSYLTELDKMTPAERKLARNAKARELRRSKYSASEWSERKAMQSRMQRIKEKEVSLNAGGKAVRKEKQAEIALKAAADKAAREARITARTESMQRKRQAEKAARKAFASENSNGIIKSIDIDDLKTVTYGKNIKAEVVDYIHSEMSKLERKGGFVFSEVFVGKLPKEGEKVAILQTEMLPNGLLRLNINTDVIAGRTIAELDAIFAEAEGTVCNSFRDAMVHEAGHAKLINGKTPEQVEELYKELGKKIVEGISDRALSDGAEGIAEIEVLLERGAKVPDEALKTYKEFMK